MDAYNFSASICILSCWSMCPVKDRYIHYEKAGDQFVGIAVTGISLLSKYVGVYPVHFTYKYSPVGYKKDVEDKNFNSLVIKEKVPPTTFVLINFYLQSSVIIMIC